MTSFASAHLADSPERILIFDVGANIGVKTARFVARGARVVCFDPVPECLNALRSRFDGDPSVTIVPYALGAVAGTLPISICSGATTISTFSEDWKQGRFKNMVWDKTLEVPVQPLDAAIAEYGLPDYCKIDVEGFELSVLQGLTRAIPVLSFEFCGEGLSQTSACLERLSQLGYHRFNFAYGEVPVMRHDHWLDAAKVMAELREHACTAVWGDIYAAQDQAPRGGLAALLPSSPLNDDLPAPDSDTLDQLLWRGLTFPGMPVRLHLGAGEHLLPGYVNIDYPSEYHNVMKVRPELAADITTLTFPPHSVDEVRLHHVFEHFNRVVALGLLIRWQRWLKLGGRLLIETPDFEGEARSFLRDLPELNAATPTPPQLPQPLLVRCLRRLERFCAPPKDEAPSSETVTQRSFSDRMSAVRSLEGDQTAAWAYHVGHWFSERFEQTLCQLGFEDITIHRSLSAHTPALHNITVTAARGLDRTEEEQLEAGYTLLWYSTVAEAERPTWEIWCQQLKQFLLSVRLPNLSVPHRAVPVVEAGDPIPRQPVVSLKRGPGVSLVIAVRLLGGLGNQLFQYAAARALSLRVGTDLLLDVSGLQADPLRRFHLSAFKIGGRVVSSKEIIESDLSRYDEPFYHYDEAFKTIERGTLLAGYFQSARYFEDYAERIRADLEPSASPSGAFDAYAAAIRASPLPVSVHVRRGDMFANPQTSEFHGFCGADYYNLALKVISGLLGATPDYFVFSDDRAAAAELFRLSSRFVFVETDTNCPWEDLMLMSLCRHHILANSSFSWWGAWLNRRPNKIMVAPRYWVAPKTLRQLNTADLYQEGTIII
jgi:FkbM family methyltransferase